MSLTPAAAEVLRALSGIVSRFGPWYLFGAQAVIAYGVPRLSADVDVTLRLAEQSPEAFVEAMRAAGFEIRIKDPTIGTMEAVSQHLRLGARSVNLFPVIRPRPRHNDRNDERPVSPG